MGRLKRVDKQSRYIIFGCIREIESTLDATNVNLFKNIPLLVTSLCMTYYFIPEFFDDSISNQIKLTNYKRNMRTNYRNDKLNYGSITISSTNKLISEWHLKIKHIKGMMNGIHIGISSMIDNDKKKDNNHYGYYGGGFVFETIKNTKKWRSYCCKFGDDDKISMRLDFKSDPKRGILT